MRLSNSVASKRLFDATNAATVFMKVKGLLGEYVDQSDAFLDVASTYVLLSYVHMAFDAVPYLMLVGAPGTGKTLTGQVLEHLAFSPVLAASVTTAAITRILAHNAGTLILDEQTTGSREWTSMLRVGYRRSGTIIVAGPDGGIEERLCYGPKIFLLNEPLSDAALLDRVLTLETRPGESRRVYLAREVELKAASIRDELYRLGLGIGSQLLDVAEQVRDDSRLKGRTRELAVPMLTLAKLIDRDGGEHPPGLEDALVHYFEDESRRRQDLRKFDSDAANLIRLARSFTGGNLSAEVQADEFTEYVNASSLFERRLRPKEVGRKLHGLRLVAGRSIKDVKAGINTGTVGKSLDPKPRIQRVYYKFDQARILALAADLGV